MNALDTNILVYAMDRTDDPRHAIAAGMMAQAVAESWLLPVQVMAELMNVASRKRSDLRHLAVTALASLQIACTLVETLPNDILTAFALANHHQLQYFDALIITAAARAGATTLYSEDMQNGLTIGPLTVRNPFI